MERDKDANETIIPHPRESNNVGEESVAGSDDKKAVKEVIEGMLK